MKYLRYIKNIVQKYLFIFYVRNFNFSNVTVFCYNVTPVFILKYLKVKSKIFSNHGIAYELYKGLIKHSKTNVLFINENSPYIKYLPKSWSYIYHFSPYTYKEIFKKNTFSLITSGNTFKYNNNAINQKLINNSSYGIDSFRFMQIEEHHCCLRAESILSIGTKSVLNEFEKEYPNKPIFQIKNSTYFPNFNDNLLIDKKEVVMVAGKGSLHKGVDIYFKLAKLNPNIKFNLIHLFDLEEFLIPENVIVHGFILPTNPLFTKICLRSRITCFFSISEGFPGSLCDSLSFRLLPLVPKELGLEFNNYFEYDSFEDLILKFKNLYYDVNSLEKKQNDIDCWKERNIEINVFRNQLKEYLVRKVNS